VRFAAAEMIRAPPAIVKFMLVGLCRINRTTAKLSTRSYQPPTFPHLPPTQPPSPCCLPAPCRNTPGLLSAAGFAAIASAVGLVVAVPDDSTAALVGMDSVQGRQLAGHQSLPMLISASRERDGAQGSSEFGDPA